MNTAWRKLSSAIPAVALLLLLNTTPSFAASSLHGTQAVNSRGMVYLVQAVKIGSLAKPAIRVFNTRAAAIAAIPQNNIILGTLWDNSPPGGDSLVIYGPNCDQYGVSDLQSWDDRTSSLDNSCTSVTLYSLPNYDGVGGTYGNGRTNYVGDIMNNQAESVKFFTI